MCIYAYIYIYTYVYIYICTYIYACVYISLSVTVVPRCVSSVQQARSSCCERRPGREVRRLPTLSCQRRHIHLSLSIYIYIYVCVYVRIHIPLCLRYTVLSIQQERLSCCERRPGRELRRLPMHSWQRRRRIGRLWLRCSRRLRRTGYVYIYI